MVSMQATRAQGRYRGAVVALALAAAALPLTPLAALGQAQPTLAALSVAQISPFKQAVAEAAGEDAALSAFYRERGYAPLWTSADDAERRRAFLSALARAGEHALPAARYDIEGLKAAFHAVQSERDRGRLEVRMSRAFLQYASDLHSGILDPASVDSNLVREVPRLDSKETLERLAASHPTAVLRSVMPTAPEYNRLLRARFLLEEQMRRGGWGPRVQAGSLRPGDRGTQVVALRNRLIAMGYMERSAAISYDAELQSAVQRFQANHGIEPDGIANAATIRTLNVSPETRMEAIMVALERERWLNIPRGERHVWVNLTDFTARIVDRDRVTFETVAIIGMRDHSRQTPEFSEDMTYIEINPDWTIPRSIVARSYLGALQGNPYAHGHLEVIDGNGNVVPRNRVNFARYTIRTLPFNLRQPPGPSNPLGKVKFMFPNPHAIYLHDTPSRSLFSTQVLAHSNGCVRLNDPEEFAYELLSRQADVEDPVEYFHTIHRSGQQTRVYLDTPVPTHLVYRTAFTNVVGEMNYRDDVYGRDARILAALRRAGVMMPGLSS